MNGFSEQMKRLRAHLLWCDKASYINYHYGYASLLLARLSTEICNSRGEGFSELTYERSPKYFRVELYSGWNRNHRARTDIFYDEVPSPYPVSNPSPRTIYYYSIMLTRIRFPQASGDWEPIKQLGLWSSIAPPVNLHPNYFVYGFEFNPTLHIKGGEALVIEPETDRYPQDEYPGTHASFSPEPSNPDYQHTGRIFAGQVWGVTGYAQCAHFRAGPTTVLDNESLRTWARYRYTFAQVLTFLVDEDEIGGRYPINQLRSSRTGNWDVSHVRVTLRADTDRDVMMQYPGAASLALNSWSMTVFHENHTSEIPHLFREQDKSKHPERGWYITNFGSMNFYYWAIQDVFIKTVGLNLISYRTGQQYIDAEGGFAHFPTDPDPTSDAGIRVPYGNTPVILSGDFVMTLDMDRDATGRIYEHV